MKRIPLTRGLFALVDDADFERLNQWKWYAHKDRNTFYAARRVLRDGVSMLIYMHRLLLDPPKGMQVDHINRDSLDDQRHNLRLCTNQQNAANSISRKGGSKYKGVCWDKQRKKWRALIRLHYKLHHLGYFKDETEAAKAYNEAARKFFGEFAHLNKIESEVA